MRKQLGVLLCVIMVLFALGCGASATPFTLDGSVPSSAPGVLGDVLYSDVKAAINGHAIPSFNIDGNTMVIAEDLMNYGFDVAWDSATATLRVVSFVPSATVAPMAVPSSSRPGGTFRMNYLATDVRTFVNNIEVTGYNIGGQTIIQFDHLAAYGNVAWDGATRAISLTTREQSVGEVLPIPTIPAQHGNTSGNILNGSFAAIQGDWIYYIAKRTMLLPNNVVAIGNLTLNKIRTDGTEKTELYHDFSWVATHKDGYTEATRLQSINVVGDWIYMTHSPFGITKIRTDGTEHTILTNEECRFVTVVGDWIYYTKDERLFDERDYPDMNNWDRDQSIYKMRIDGTGKTTLVERIYVPDFTQFGYPEINFSISGDWVYYTVGAEKPSLYRIRTDGTGQTVVVEGDIDGGNFNVVGDRIYFTDTFGTLFRVRTDGTERATIATGIRPSNINAAGDWIYYITNAVYKMRTDGTQITRLRDIQTTEHYRINEINVVGDWIYCQDGSTFHKMRTDGTDWQTLWVYTHQH
jgi:hypothetical protein